MTDKDPDISWEQAPWWDKRVNNRASVKKETNCVADWRGKFHPGLFLLLNHCLSPLLAFLPHQGVWSQAKTDMEQV